MKSLLTVVTATILTLLVPSRADAGLWCAMPVWVHEWGVHVFRGDGSPTSGSLLPDWFHRQHGTNTTRPAVRDLPPDGGERDLPVIHFYANHHREIPIGLEVGFASGTATAWFPAVDAWKAAADANSEAAREARRALVSKREMLTPYDPREAPPADPTSQLIWDRLALSAEPARPAARTEVPWVSAARALPNALWVNGATESERFLFYEGTTTERVPLTIQRIPTIALNPRMYRITNHGRHAVHDVFVTHRRNGAVFTAFIETVPAGADATFTLAPRDAGAVREATRGLLTRRLGGAALPKPAGGGEAFAECADGRDPAIPVERAASHQLYPHEVDLILSVWGARFFDAPGTTVVYREDEATLNDAMPLSIYTDMFNHIVLHRAGLALWEGVALD